ncbi:LuxR family transcriptional regulator [Aurantiacibacter aquimixticola]|uniref:LuxR family transcriptional regulator n=2 Tax=Aurantiacibacter aquimixticola TaxID=1958945 RepID=A0A419RVW9_9SPHN|nr:LuxR family transcriptional regulator [Aurantiacibacter aquimixticola]
MTLVAEGQTAKEIARALGISHRTVEQHIATAIETLGASNRLGAVARFVDLEQAEQSRNNSADERAAFMLQSPSSPSESELLEESDAAADKTSEAVERWPFLPPIGGSRNAAPRKVRLGWVVRIGILALMLTCILILSIFGLVELAP